jgi:hypothetical protein
MTLSTLRQEWAQRLNALQASGQSAPAWCAQHQVNLRPWHYWKRTFSADTAAPSPLQWVSLPLTPSVSEPSLSLRVGPVVIAVQPGCNAALLRDIVDALESR